MSSSAVRTAVKSFLASDIPTETFLDMSGKYEELPEFLASEGVGMEDTWVGLEFVAADENPITVGSNNTKGKYRESGAIYFHVVDIAKLGVSDTILARAEAIRNTLRGRNISGVSVESITPPNFGPGAALNFEDGFMSCSFILEYQFDIDL